MKNNEESGINQRMAAAWRQPGNWRKCVAKAEAKWQY
jgi:hypothetical protein